jgi:NYN domain
MPESPVANIYVDGFNLYRRSLEGHSGVKWLDLVKLASHLMPGYDIGRVHYFTALLRQGLLADERAASRQSVYLRALRTMPDKVTIHFGKFRNDPRSMPVHPQQLSVQTREFVMARVRKLEEKGSDVNLAGRMVADACLRNADIFVLLSNDSDQAGTMRLLKELGAQSGIIFPMPSAKAAKELVQTRPDFRSHVTTEALMASQLPVELSDEVGTFTRPPSWA